jgi:amidophosphoribosyltransferase
MCGVIGVSTTSNNAPYFVRRGLAALQHRGQESAGISIEKPNDQILTHKAMGLVPQAISEEVLKKLGQSKLAMGQTRYGTSGASNLENAHPVEVGSGKYKLSIVHNGNIPDVTNLRKELNIWDETVSDTILMAKLFLKKRPHFSSWEETLVEALPECHGSYNLVFLTNDNTLFGMRDPYGIWSFSLGRLSDGWVIASESVAFDAIGADFVRDIAPGEVIKITPDGKIHSYFFGEPKHPQHSLFEYVYFARPDSFINGKRVRTGREESGKLLAQRIKKKGIKPDAVVPIFESGYPAAKGVAKELKLPMVDAITTSNYVGRTFIQPGQQNRIRAVNGKHNIIGDDILGKKIVVVDDSAIRMTTSKALIQELRNAGAKEVYMGIASPPVVNQCDMGIDMRNKKNLPASDFIDSPFEIIEKNIANIIGADGMIYLPIDDTTKAMGGKKEYFYWYPFGGPHPVRDKQPVFPRLKKKIEGKPKICVFISGKGTFAQDIIDGIKNHDINAEIISVVSNKEDAYGLTRAKDNNIPTKIIAYSGKLSDKDARKKYDQQLLEHVKTIKPDMIFLSGWQMVLGETFLKELQKLQIPVINQHPGLLTNREEDFVATSRGKIPVMRGAHVSKETFDKKLQVSGISVHQILPGDKFDVGPVIMKAEVRIKPDDTYDSWKAKMDETEHQVVATAIKRVLHVLENNIDISKGGYKW